VRTLPAPDDREGVRTPPFRGTANLRVIVARSPSPPRTVHPSLRVALSISSTGTGTGTGTHVRPPSRSGSRLPQERTHLTSIGDGHWIDGDMDRPLLLIARYRTGDTSRRCSRRSPALGNAVLATRLAFLASRTKWTHTFHRPGCSFILQLLRHVYGRFPRPPTASQLRIPYVPFASTTNFLN
jgi:hypothetical protein